MAENDEEVGLLLLLGGARAGVARAAVAAGVVLAAVRLCIPAAGILNLLVGGVAFLHFPGGGGVYCAPAQRVGDFLAGRASSACGGISPTYAPGVRWTALDGCLPDYVNNSLRDALPLFDRRVHGFACPEAVLTGVETRSSSPLRILRDERLQSSLRGVYPCGEGCGYAGGIVSAAVDGVRVAEAIAVGDNALPPRP